MCAGAAFLIGAAVFLERLAKAKKDPSDIDDDNIYLSENEQVTDVAETGDPTFYETIGKRVLDKTLSFLGLVALAPVFGIIAVAIQIDDPGTVIFTQKRVGKDKHYFEMHKFRSMKMSAPKDIPAEDIGDLDKYTTRVGRLLRSTGLDELPQLWDIFRGKMSFVGPRPVIWNTEDLIDERDKYGANSVMPGLTGLAQINGRDRLGNTAKAQLDGEYVNILRESILGGFLMDVSCIVGTIDELFGTEMKTTGEKES